MKTVFQEWTNYLEKIVPQGASDLQIEEIRRAFYAGALALYWLVIEASAHRDEAQCEREMETLYKEIHGIVGDLRHVNGANSVG
jgi:hypothetical protein